MIDPKSLVRSLPGVPREGVIFRDISTLLGDAAGFSEVVERMLGHFDRPVDMVAGIEARGFILGGAIAHHLSAGFVPVRKQGKLPWETMGEDYELEYGSDRLEIHRDAIRSDQRILVVDDLLATGGTAEATIRLLERAGGEVVGLSFVIDLPDLGGRERLEALGYQVETVMAFSGH